MTSRFAALLAVSALAACGGGSGSSAAPQSVTVLPTATPKATASPGPTPSPGATATASPTATPTASSAPASKLVYMIGQTALSTVAGDAKAAQILVGRKLYIILDTVEPIPASPPTVPAGWTPTWVYRWTSEATMATDFANGVPSWISIAMYDNELATAPMTPTNETDNPPHYETLAAAVAHAAGRKFWPTAGLATSNLNYPGGAAQEQTDFWNTSADWDGYAIQSQTAINDLQQFDSLITQYAAKASADNGALLFGAGVGDFAGGTFASLPTIEAAIPTIPLPTGFPMWMNFGPHAGPDCTDPLVCPIPARPDMIVLIIDFFG